jgi:hypothetical protein
MSIETAVCGANVRRAVQIAIGFGLGRLLRPTVALWGGHGRGVATVRDGQRLLAWCVGPVIAEDVWARCNDGHLRWLSAQEGESEGSSKAKHER